MFVLLLPESSLQCCTRFGVGEFEFSESSIKFCRSISTNTILSSPVPRSSPSFSSADWRRGKGTGKIGVDKEREMSAQDNDEDALDKARSALTRANRLAAKTRKEFDNWLQTSLWGYIFVRSQRTILPCWCYQLHPRFRSLGFGLPLGNSCQHLWLKLMPGL